MCRAADQATLDVARGTMPTRLADALAVEAHPT